jgi:hypothetical protein
MTTVAGVQDFFEAKVPKAWHVGPLVIELDDDEILCVATLPGDGTTDDFRKTTRAERVAIANDAAERFRRKVSWGVQGQEGERTLFTTQSAPITTRLRLPERVVLDTLVNAGVARSRADALSWCVKLVARHQAKWLADLRGALVDVERVRADGPTPL